MSATEKLKHGNVCGNHERSQVMVISSATVTGGCHSSCQLMLPRGLTHRGQVCADPRGPKGCDTWGPKKTKGGFLAEGRDLSVHFTRDIHLYSPGIMRNDPPTAVWPDSKMQ